MNDLMPFRFMKKTIQCISIYYLIKYRKILKPIWMSTAFHEYLLSDFFIFEAEQV